ncbi:MAG: CYTH domain-containing protein [Chloroflexi bacterium]|nr:CYTH domain-containing protein [Chloroflexota bacterium]
MTLEVELKYRAADDGPLRRLAIAPMLGRADLGAADPVGEIDRYLDTDDGRLASARWACRLRHRRGTTRLFLKGPAVAGSGGGLHRRTELEGPATDELDPEAWPHSPARELLDRLRDGHPLEERVRLVQRRTERTVLVDGDPIGTLTLDVVRVEADGRQRGILHAVELELAAASQAHEALLDELDATLRTVNGLEPDDRTKLEHALDCIADR